MRRMFAALTIASLSVLPFAAAQTPEPYRPGLGDLMTMTVQPRHIKLALAGAENNWLYAKYELHELEEALQRAARVWPKYKGLPLGGMVDAIIQGPMAAVGQAIADGDSERFQQAYRGLTDGCNACHQAANVAHVVIKTPDGSSFPDQDFRPNRP